MTMDRLIKNLMLVLTIVAIPTTIALEFTYKQQSRCGIINKNTGRAQKLDCLLDPEAVEGPYYLPALNVSRSDIRESEPGIQLNLNLIIMNTSSCEPIQNAIVDIWHCNSTGAYSGFQNEGTSGLTFLRGMQISNTNGEVNFVTIFPGWYTGRSVHIHIEVFIGGSVKHIGQFFFANSDVDLMKVVSPYSTSTQRLQYNEVDGIYSSSNGAETTLELTGDTTSGFSSIMYIGVNPEASISGAITIHLFKSNGYYTLLSWLVMISFAISLI